MSRPPVTVTYIKRTHEADSIEVEIRARVGMPGGQSVDRGALPRAVREALRDWFGESEPSLRVGDYAVAVNVPFYPSLVGHVVEIVHVHPDGRCDVLLRTDRGWKQYVEVTVEPLP